jgi:hypothetical protein
MNITLEVTGNVGKVSAVEITPTTIWGRLKFLDIQGCMK